MKKVSLVPILISLLFVSCASSGVEKVKPLRCNMELSEKQLSYESYVFIRFYDAFYDKPLRPGNFLRMPIKLLGKASDGVVYNHSSISTKLSDDSFVSISLSGNRNMVQYENVLNLEANEFMSTIDSKKSRCMVIALPCAESERLAVGALLDYALSGDSSFKYGIMKTATTGIRHWKNSKAYKRSRNFPIEFAFGPLPVLKGPEEIFDQKVFVCSNFISFILKNSIERYRVDFLVNRIDYEGVSPVDLTYLDGAMILFECGFEDYDRAMKEFVELYPRFRKFIEQ
ncbi:hypothetical protein [Treponema sp.]|uniref:hypothetical protein n=1 Tax=Treponema sp. TaxID=166 RepID=UPI0038906890